MSEKTLVYIRNEQIQSRVEDDFGIKVPIDRVFCVKEKIYNSPLWFEMWRWDSEYINDYYEYQIQELIDDNGKLKTKLKDSDNPTSILILLIYASMILFIILMIINVFSKLP